MNELARELLALPPQASTYAKDIDFLHYFVISVTMLGATLVALAAVYFVARYRRRRDRLTEHVRIPLKLEFSFIGLLFFLFVLWWVIGFRVYTRTQVPPPNAMEVYVTAKQWMWKFAYPNGRSQVSVLTVPVNRPVRLVMTSRDVIHSLSIPAFRIKQDVLPGTYTSLWFEATKEGSYQILCAEYCGVSHSNMWARVDVLPAEDFEAWLEGRESFTHRDAVDIAAAERPHGRTQEARAMYRGISAGQSEQMAVRGREAAVRHGCVACHTVDGRRHIGPSFAGLFRSEVELENGETIVADAAYLTESMMDPRARIVAGFAPLMPTYQGLLSAGETAALVEFIKSLQHQERSDTPFPGRDLGVEVVPMPEEESPQ